MFILKSLILVISFILSLTGRCPKKPFSKGQCSSHEFLQDQEIYEVKQWKKGFRCNYLEKNKIFLQRWFNKKLPGDDCTKNSECYSNSCKDKVCKGKKEGILCQSHFECNVGLACIEGKCQLQRKKNELCTEDFQCNNEMGCSQFGKCVKYMSLLPGEFSNFLLCSNLTINENGYCVVSRLNQTTTECADEQNVCEYFTKMEWMRQIIRKIVLAQEEMEIRDIVLWILLAWSSKKLYGKWVILLWRIGISTRWTDLKWIMKRKDN